MRQLDLTPRLHAVAHLVPQGACLADIGTDHAYLPVFLLLNGKIKRAIAADLREGPLNRARLTAQQYECHENIDFRLCDGLAGIRAEEVDTVVIAGMGGETISAILDAAAWTRNEQLTLILQPMSAQNELRRWLWQHDFNIETEEIICEADKLYNILLVRFGDAKPMTIAEEWAGRQSKELVQPLRGEYLTRLLEKTRRAMDGISRGKGAQDGERYLHLQQLMTGLTALKEEWDLWHG